MKSIKKFEDFGPASGSSGCAGPTGSVGYSTHSTTAYHSESNLPIMNDLELIPINKNSDDFHILKNNKLLND